MQPVIMLNNINMEFIQAFNPLYAVPIVAVILCAFIVYAFGFKSPVQPPSFEGIELEKRSTKKRRVKDNSKGSLSSKSLLQNGKVNGSALIKSSVPKLSKKKEPGEKDVASEKSSNLDKSGIADKKVPKKKVANEKKSIQERKKESFSHEELNDDGWVQLISKKGRKSRKKDDASVTETQSSSAPVLAKTGDANKSDDSSQVEESPKKNAELPKKNAESDKSSKDQKELTSAPTKEVVHDKNVVSNLEKPKVQNIVVEVSKPDNNDIEKQTPKEPAAKGTKVLEESSKSKKKKKKNQEIHSESVPSGTISSNMDSSEKLELSAPKETTITTPAVTDLPHAISVKVEVDQKTPESSSIKSSNVAFDELAGHYTDTKEQKKKKRVRRDH